MDEPVDTATAAAVERLRKAIQEELDPYTKQIGEGFDRVNRLGRLAVNLTRGLDTNQKTADDIFRSIES